VFLILALLPGNKIYQLQKYIHKTAVDIFKLDTYFNFNLNTVFIAKNKIDALLKIDHVFTKATKKYGYKSIIGSMLELALPYFIQSNEDIETEMKVDWETGPDFDTAFIESLLSKYAERFTDYLLDKFTYDINQKISTFADTDEIIDLYIIENPLIK
jgi:hypothetical protein